MVNFLSNYLIDTLEPYTKWVTIALFIPAIISIIVFCFVNKAWAKKTIKIEIICMLFYALVVGITLLSLEIAKKYDTAYLEDNWVNLKVIKLVFVPLVITLAFALLSVIAVFILKLKNAKITKLVSVILGAICSALAIVSVILMAIYYNKYIHGDGYYTGDYGKLNSVMLYVCAGVLIALVVGGAFLFGRKDKNEFDTKSIAFAGVTMAISFVLSYVKMWQMPQGGSITLVSMLPIMIFSYVYGVKKGVIVGALYGVLQAIQDPWLIHPAQFFLDYPIAFCMVGFTGVLKDFKFLENLPQVKFVIGGIICGVLRYVSHVLSGVFAFGAYAVDAGKNLFVYSLAYNSFVFIDIAIVIVVGAIVFSSKAFQRVVQEKFSQVESE